VRPRTTDRLVFRLQSFRPEGTKHWFRNRTRACLSAAGFHYSLRISTSCFHLQKLLRERVCWTTAISKLTKHLVCTAYHFTYITSKNESISGLEGCQELASASTCMSRDHKRKSRPFSRHHCNPLPSVQIFMGQSQNMAYATNSMKRVPWM
jgi:hypothetical protein